MLDNQTMLMPTGTQSIGRGDSLKNRSGMITGAERNEEKVCEKKFEQNIGRERLLLE